MNLFDPSRPYLPNGKSTWLRGDIEIANLEIFPLENNNLEISIFLPTKNPKFKTKKFSLEISPQELITKIESFVLDPETFCEENFTSKDEDLKPQLRIETKSKIEPKPTKIKTSLNLELEF